MVALFDRWESVWHDARHDLVPQCVRPLYIRHNEAGDRTVTREAYAAELLAIRQARPGIRVAVHDHRLHADSAWFRFTFQWRDVPTGEPRNQAGMQSYRIEDGLLAETWVSLMPPGSAWSDPPQARWTAPRRSV